MLLLIDNYDSFTYNLYQYLSELGADVMVRRNDGITVDEAERLAPTHIVISPGPCTPHEAGVSNALIERLGPRIPLLGVCLGHQCIGAVFGGRVIRAPEPVHGKTSLIRHDGRGVFAGLPNPFEAIRYHSLIVERATLPDALAITAETISPAESATETPLASPGEGPGVRFPALIMGLRHRAYPIQGMQFHPESILTGVGKDLLRNFLNDSLIGLAGDTASELASVAASV
ncbi:MAG TPA: aminodeoxychorismate/anthranilate synthase component II [Ktedonobacterales bacterium]|nr:aminodeoxychorismate/anthranilate synthase component II [Ktedonobacterales bacterium]